MINGVDDPRMPLAAVHALYDPARDPRCSSSCGPGIYADDSALIPSLTHTAMARLPGLGAQRRGECRGNGGAVNFQRSTDSDQTKDRITDRHADP